MSLKDILYMFGTTITGKDNYTVIAFSSLTEADNFVKYHDKQVEDKEYEILFTIHSEFKPCLYLKEDILNKNVEWIQAMDRDVFVIVIDKIF